MTLSDLASIMAPTMLCALIGFVWRWSGQPFEPNFVARLVSSVGAPFLVFSTLTRLHVSHDHLAQLALATGVCMMGFALMGFLAAAGARKPWRDIMPIILFPNAGNMGLPICLFAFGETGLVLAIIYSTITSVLQQTLGLSISRGAVSLKHLFRMPVLYALVAALCSRGLDLPPPEWLATTARLLGDITIPMMLLALGATLANLRPVKPLQTVALCLVRMVGGGAVGWGVAWGLGLPPLASAVVITESAMPVAVFSYLFAERFNRVPHEVASAVLVSTGLSIVLLPLLLKGLVAT